MISYQNLISQKGSFLDPFYIAQNINIGDRKQERLDPINEYVLSFKG